MSSLIVRSLIGAGGYGHVYHASWKGRRVAIKKFFVVKDDVRQTAAIQHEIDMLKALVDRHIIQFYGTTYHEGMLVIIMDYAEGGSLQRAINGGRISDWSTKTRISQEIARGLAYIHHERVIHRDLKSLNVLLTRLMEVKLCDFGLATVKVHSASMSTTLKGTYRWMAPELLALKPKYSFKSDMYALGMVMWEMAANCTMPFKEQADNHTVVTFVTKGEREELPDDTPHDYRKWVERCWAQNPQERPDASEMVAEDDDDFAVVADEAGTDASMMTLSHDMEGVHMSPSFGSVSSKGASGVVAVGDQAPVDVGPLRRRAHQGDVESQMALAAMFEKGAGVDQDDAEAFGWYLRAAEQGSIEAQWKTGELFYQGRGTSKDFEVAARWTQKAAERGHAMAERVLGWMYTNGHGVEQDYEKAVSWFRRSAEKGNAMAQNNLAVVYEYGHGVQQDYVEAVFWYRKSAEQGNAMAQNNLGMMYAGGHGVERDYAEAVLWYRKSAEQGNAAAQYSLGVMYAGGHGVERDHIEAAFWYRKSSEQGDARAQYRLGTMYAKGHGVKQDYGEAASWYRRSSELGEAKAQYRLGVMYENGQGFDKDIQHAIILYRKAADQGNAQARERLVELT
ncbi:hypothetical protein DFQ27_001569 [Actinomortierella ambigua]|uniref:Protein kinase domain-containing protein n=1 Tax=Actinomortierella ambigua TaxID=1343610 RepID=A0A9P6U7H9_9FUNG|nr:hypothetical protein DFQ27_001569 [Actinomortierella ambigua]